LSTSQIFIRFQQQQQQQQQQRKRAPNDYENKNLTSFKPKQNFFFQAQNFCCVSVFQGRMRDLYAITRTGVFNLVSILEPTQGFR
jgi:hypothetical protein